MIKNKKGYLPVVYVFSAFVVSGIIGYPAYKAGKIGAGGELATVGKVEFKDKNGATTTDRSQAWFEQKRP